MSIFRRRSEFESIERELRAARSQPNDEFTSKMTRRVEDAGELPASRRRRSFAPQIGIAVALTAALLLPMAAFGGFAAASGAVKSAASSTKTSVSKIVSKPKAKPKQSKLAAKKSKAAAAARSKKRYLAQVTVDVYGGNSSNWPWRDTNNNPLTANVYKVYICHQKNTIVPSWKVVGLNYAKWSSNISNHSSHLNDLGY